MDSVMGKTVPITDGAWQEAVFAIVRAAGDALVRPVMCPSSSSCTLHQLGVCACYQAAPIAGWCCGVD